MLDKYYTQKVIKRFTENKNLALPRKQHILTQVKERIQFENRKHIAVGVDFFSKMKEM